MARKQGRPEDEPAANGARLGRTEPVTPVPPDADPALAELHQVHESVARYQEQYPWMDAVALETNRLFIRAFETFRLVQNAYLGNLGTSPARVNVLRLLYQSENRRLLLSQIGARLNVTKTNVTNLIDRLERDGLVRRVDHPTDRRMTYTELTPEGAAHFEAVLPHNLRKIGELWSVFDLQEQQLFARMLSRLRHHLLNISADIPELPTADGADRPPDPIDGNGASSRRKNRGARHG